MKELYGQIKRYRIQKGSFIGILCKGGDNKTDYIICSDLSYVTVRTPILNYDKTRVSPVTREKLLKLYSEYEQGVDLMDKLTSKDDIYDLSSEARVFIDRCSGKEAILNGISYTDSITGIVARAVDKTIKKADILEGTTEICAEGFMDCHYLEEVKLPSTLFTIGDKAFKNCIKIETLSIPEKVTSLGDYAFYKSGLSVVSLPESLIHIGDYCFGSTHLVMAELPSKLKELGWCVYYSCKKLINLKIKAKLRVLPVGLCKGCESLHLIENPKTVTVLEEEVFAGCKELRNVDLTRISQMGEACFRDCEFLN